MKERGGRRKRAGLLIVGVDGVGLLGGLLYSKLII